MNTGKLYPWFVWLAWVLVAPMILTALAVIAVAATPPGTLKFDGAPFWWLAFAVPAAALFVVYGVLQKRRGVARFTSSALAPLLAQRVSATRQALRGFLLVSAVLMIVAGIIGPRWGLFLDKQKVRGIDVAIALDVSRSMLARDLSPSRLDHAKRVIRQQLVERSVFQGANRFALLTFAGSTSVKVPLTTDHSAFRERLERVYVGSAPRGGTAIAEGIRRAGDLLAKSPEEATKIILVFTDGEDHEGGAVEAAKTALSARGIRTFTIGVGDPSRTSGAPVPAAENQPDKPLLYDGQIVFSRLDVDGLRRIAAAGDGRYAPIQDFHLLVDAMANMRKTRLATEERVRHRPRYQWFVALAILMLVTNGMIRERASGPSGAPQRVWQQEFAV